MNTTVLVVEDDMEINELLGEYLGLEGIKYLQATTGKEGLRLAQQHHPDAIILDVMLPDIDGFEVSRTLTTRRATHDIPVVMLTCMCQACHREKGFATGALAYMNKPFLPDDLLKTLRLAFEWKSALRTRQPFGAVMLAEKDPVACSRAINEMTADIFARTDLPDDTTMQIRDAIETLAAWARQWNRDHQAATQVRLDYKINEAGPNFTAVPTVEWKLSEDRDGMLADAFFKTATVSSGGGLVNNVTGLIGWGSNALVAKTASSIAPPSAWLQVLAKTGAARFEKDTPTHTVRFARRTGEIDDATAAVGSSAPIVPVVEIDGTRYPTRLRDEALAAKKK